MKGKSPFFSIVLHKKRKTMDFYEFVSNISQVLARFPESDRKYADLKSPKLGFKEIESYSRLM